MRVPRRLLFMFEEDCCEQVVLRELMDKKLWTPPADRIKDAAAFELK